MHEKQVKLAAEKPHVGPTDLPMTFDLDLKSPANQCRLAIHLLSNHQLGPVDSHVKSLIDRCLTYLPDPTTP